MQECALGWAEKALLEVFNECLLRSHCVGAIGNVSLRCRWKWQGRGSIGAEGKDPETCGGFTVATPKELVGVENVACIVVICDFASCVTEDLDRDK
jgi:hypothetical protein